MMLPIDGRGWFMDYWVDHIGPNKMRVSTNIDGFIRFFPVAVLNVNSFHVLVAECPMFVDTFSQDNMLKGTSQGMKVDLHVAPFRWKVGWFWHVILQIC